MVKQHIEAINDVYPYIHVDKYIIMPNHIHMILFITGGPPRCADPTKSSIAKSINALKSLTSREFGESMWHRSYYDRIIRNEAEYQKIWQYIDGNPIKWSIDK